MSGLCGYCDKISFEHLVHLTGIEVGGQDFPVQAFFQLHPSFRDLEESADHGCALCLLVLRRYQGTRYTSTAWPTEWTGPQCDVDSKFSMYAAALRLEQSDVKIAITAAHFRGGDMLWNPTALDQIMVQVGRRRTSKRLHRRDDEKRIPPLILTVTVPSGPRPVIGAYRLGRFPICPNLGDPDNFELARLWLDDCQKNHETCPSTTLTRLPTRVVDVGLYRNEQPRIAHTHGRKAHYVTLSHCWGGSIPTVLTQSSLKSFTTALPFDTLPANFRDAITITRELGIQYLWIDSLCIIQDSKKDWEEESKTMSDVYRNSVITISAMASEKVTDGILATKFTPSQDIKPALLKVSTTNSCDEMMLAIEPYSYRETMHLLDGHSPLSQRGWVMQESLLSRRQLCYGARQIYFKCLSGLQSYDGVHYSPYNPHLNWPNIVGLLHLDQLDPQPPAESQLAAVEEYYSLVGRYSRRMLTVDSDKLPALAGICQLLHRAVGGEYIAGLWSSHFNRGLLWQPAGTEQCKHVKEYRAPSWSWAATNAPVMWPARVADPDVKENHDLNLRLIFSAIKPRDISNPFGELVSRFVTVEARTVPVVRSRRVFGDMPENIVGSCSVDEEPDDSPFVESSPKNLLLPTRDSGDCIFAISTPSPVPMATPAPVLMPAPVGNPAYELDNEELLFSESLIGMIVDVVEETWDGDTQAQGLLLKPVVGEFGEAFERIGYFRIFDMEVDRLAKWEMRRMKLV